MERIWWRQITKASVFCEKIIQALAEGDNVILKMPRFVPWYNTLKDIVCEGIVNNGIQRRIADVDGNQDPGWYLLENYCKREIRGTYRVGKSLPVFLAEQESIPLNDMILWIRCENSDDLSKWVAFIHEYDRKLPGSRCGAMFVLEIRGEDAAGGGRRIQCISFSAEISAYDKYTFCTLVSASVSMEAKIKPYLAELVSSVCTDDVELCAICIEDGMEFAKDPANYLKRISDLSYRSDGTPFEINLSQEELGYRVWESQLRMIFPRIEQFRMQFIRTHYDDIRKNLPQETAFGEIIEDPVDAEIGLLYYLSKVGGIVMPDPTEFSRVKMCRDARNDLAHVTPLPFDVVYEILTGKHAPAAF